MNIINVNNVSLVLKKALKIAGTTAQIIENNRAKAKQTKINKTFGIDPAINFMQIVEPKAPINT